MPSINRQRNTEGLKTKTEQSRLYQIAVRMWDPTLSVCRITQSFWKTFFKNINTMWTSNSTGKNLPKGVKPMSTQTLTATSSIVTPEKPTSHQSSEVWVNGHHPVTTRNEAPMHALWMSPEGTLSEQGGTQRAPAARECSKPPVRAPASQYTLAENHWGVWCVDGWILWCENCVISKAVLEKKTVG